MGSRLFVDVNVVVDLLTAREPFRAEAERLFSAAADGSLALGCSALTAPLAYYFTAKALGHARATEAIARLLNAVEIVAVDRALLEEAQANPIDDLEDAVQYACALRFDADAIVTRDAKGFVAGDLPVFTAAEWLSRLR